MTLFLGRIRFLIFSFTVLALILFLRLFYWQIAKADELIDLAKGQYLVSKTIPAHRGLILASDGFPLASSQESWALWASPKKIEDPQKVASRLAPFFIEEVQSDEGATESAKTQKELIGEQEERVKNILLGKKEASWVALKRKIGREVKEKIEAMDILGLGFDPEEKRSYPEATMAAHLLGFVGKDAAGQDRGYFGLEGYYDLGLSGASGKRDWEKDVLGNPILAGLSKEISPLDGVSLKTHIDRSIQFIVERHLEEGLRRYGASQGLVVVMRPRDGAILAMAALPSYNPAKYNLFNESLFINPAVSESFEPGSIFKVLVMAAALDAKAVGLDDKCDSCTGPRRIGEYTIRTWNDKYHPDSTPQDIITNSDNVGMIWVAEKLGKDKLFEYLERFGIGKLSGIDLQGEAKGKLKNKEEWGLIDLATVSFGQGVAVTAVQMMRAVAAIANEGRMPVPRVVERIVSQGREYQIPFQKPPQVISPQSTREITEMMVNAAGKLAPEWVKSAGFRVAGKTGTAQIPIAGYYDPKKTIVSFIGFAPVPLSGGAGPKFVMLVSLREPKNLPWGSGTAAPLWFSIARDLFPYLGIRPDS